MITLDLDSVDDLLNDVQSMSAFAHGAFKATSNVAFYVLYENLSLLEAKIKSALQAKDKDEHG